MGKWANGHKRKTWPIGESLKRASKMQLRNVGFRSAGHSKVAARLEVLVVTKTMA